MQLSNTLVASACVFIGAAALPAQQDPSVRFLEDKGVYFKLPQNWNWGSESINVISIRQSIKLKDEEHPIEAELAFEPGKLADDAIKDIKRKVDDGKGDYKDYKLTKKTKLGKQSASLAAFIRVRGEGAEQKLFEERVFVFRRGDGCFTWTERNPKVVSSQSSGTFDTARKSFTFKATAETTVADEIQLDEIKGKFVLPDDFEWGDRASVKKGEQRQSDEPGKMFPRIDVRTTVSVKDNDLNAYFLMFTQKFEADLTKFYDANLKGKSDEEIAKGVFDEHIEKGTIKFDKKSEVLGAKAYVCSYIGALQKDGPRMEIRKYYVCRRGQLIQWIEAVPLSKTPSPEVLDAVKRARAALQW